MEIKQVVGGNWNLNRYREVEKEMFELREKGKCNDVKYFSLIKERAILEESKCTGPTKKASSTSKGKKWMQCVKNPNGKGYKRVHFGQRGVKVTGKSGNTKRKKSFRARHKCSTAKPGTAKYLSCKNW